MRELTTMVLDQALAQCAIWRAGGRLLSVSVNVSATNILDVGFTDLIRRQLLRHHLPASALVLEITETTIISDFERCKRVVDELCELGCVVSIDDFGAGFTSLPYLSRLTIGELKLDRTFLLELATGEGQRLHPDPGHDRSRPRARAAGRRRGRRGAVHARPSRAAWAAISPRAITSAGRRRRPRCCSSPISPPR